MGIKSALFWFGFVLILALIWKWLDLPPEEELIDLVSGWIDTYGLQLVFLGSFLEALLLVGLYFPGSLVIFLGVGLASSSTEAFVSVLAVSAGMFGGYLLNYMLGRYGWYRVLLRLGLRPGIERAQHKMQQSDVRYIFYTFWNPGLAAFTTTAAGILQQPPKRFFYLCVAAIVVWNTFWGVLVYSLGRDALRLLDFTVVLLIIGVWIVFEIGLVVWKKFFIKKSIRH